MSMLLAGCMLSEQAGGGGGVSGRYFRLQCTDGRTGFYAMAEIRVLDGSDTNIALGTTCTASSNHSAPYTAANLTDGGLVPATDNWLSLSNANNPWIKIDLGSIQSFEKYQLVGPSGSIGSSTYMTRDWYIEVSDDDSSWTTIDTVVAEPAWAQLEEREYIL